MKAAIKLSSKDGGKKIMKALETDYASPLTGDTADFFIEIGKGIISIGKEILF